MKLRVDEYNSSEKITIFSMLKDIVLEKDLIWLLAKRELIARYRRSFLGLAWSLLTPIATASVLYFVLSSVFKAKLAGGTGYAAFLMAGILLSNHLNQGGTSVGFSYSGNAGIVTKIRTKPLIFPFVAVFGSYINFLLGLVPLVIFLLLEQIDLKLTLLAVPILGIFLTLLILGLGIHVAVLASRYHDIHGIMSVIYNILGYATPIIYPLTIVHGSLRTLIMLNPFTGYVECIRGLAIDSKYFPSTEWLFYTLVVTFLIFVSALWRLRRSYVLIVESL
jgi:ABC-type polysaccharide/polyol phosphate export permease